MKKILDNLEDLSVESSFNLLTDFLKRVGAGIIIGIAMAILFGWASYNISFLKELFDRYEYVSYDSRIRYKVGDISGEMAIDDVVIIDIETSSVAPTEEGGLGRYFNWPHSYHGQLINTVSSGNPKAILFDMIVDPENTFNYDLVNALQSENKPNQALDEVTQQYLVSNDPSRFVEATFNTQKAYHGLEFGYADTMNFLYPMDSEPEGYYYDNHIIKGVSEEAKKRLPPGERFNNTHVDLLSASVGAGSVTFLVDEDGVIRRAPTAIYFEGADHVYPSLVLSGIIDILGIKKDGGFD